jgi:hypothetical protein
MIMIFNVFAWLTETIFGLERVSPLGPKQKKLKVYQDYRFCANGKKSNSFHLTVVNENSAYFGKTLCGYSAINDIENVDIDNEYLQTQTDVCKKCLAVFNKINGI